MAFRPVTEDLAIAARGIRRHPRSPIFLVLIVALAIGSLLGIFDCARQVLRGTLPFRDPASLVLGDSHSSEFLISVYNWKPNPRAGDVFSQVAEFHFETDILDSASGPRRLLIACVTPNFFTTLGVRMALGTDLPNVAPPWPPIPIHVRPIVISHELWRDAFGADPSIVGRVITTKLLYPYRYLVVGVAPAGVQFPPGADAWMPEHLVSFLTVQNAAVPNWVDTAVARLKPGTTVAQAEAAIRSWPRHNSLWIWNHSSALIPIRKYLGGDFYRLSVPLWLLTILFLALAIAATASIWALEFDERREGFRICGLLGASPGRLLRARGFELAAVLAAALGGALLARAAVVHFAQLALQQPLPAGHSGVTPADLAIAGAVAGLLLLLICAREARELGALPRLFGTARRSASGWRWPVTLVTAAVILITALVLVRVSYRISRIDPGLNAKNAFVGEVVLPVDLEKSLLTGIDPKLPESVREKLRDRNLLQFDRRMNFEYSLITGRMRGHADVAAGGVISIAPYSGYPPHGADASLSRTPAPMDSAHFFGPQVVSMSPSAIPALGMRLIYGRNFRGREDEDRNTVIVNQALARRAAPGAGSVGQYLDFLGLGSFRIVGVVADVREKDLFAPVVPTAYLPFSQWGHANVNLVLRGRGRLSYGEAYSIMESSLHSVEPQAILTRFRSLGDMVDAAAALTRYTTWFLAALAALGLLLVIVCAWAECASDVRRREHEIGIRLALGAETNRLARSMAGRRIAPVALAACLGAIVAYWLAHAVSFLFHGATPTAADFIVGAAAIAALALAASTIAFWRAIRRTPRDLISRNSV